MTQHLARPVERNARGCRALSYLFAVLAVLTAITLVPHLSNSADLVRMRNALLLDSDSAAYAWPAAAPPAGFAVEQGTPNALFRDVVQSNELRVEGDDWATALKIGRHLLAGATRSGGAIQSNLDDTYRRIVMRGEGYCGDFADVFTGLANSAGVFSRPWAFSFDGFGGNGHIFNEIWDSGQARWVMIDVFNNLYFADEQGQALSAIELHDLLKNGSTPRLVPVAPEARPGFKYEDKAVAYYRQGLSEWYMWWGNNVFEYDQSPLVRALGNTHRAFEQLGGIAAGVHPRIRILDSEENVSRRQDLAKLGVRLHVLAVFIALALAFALAAKAVSGLSRSRRPQ